MNPNQKYVLDSDIENESDQYLIYGDPNSPGIYHSSEPLHENVDKLVTDLRRRFRRGNLLSFRDWIKSVKELLNLID
jgi:hypothetical protein